MIALSYVKLMFELQLFIIHFLPLSDDHQGHLHRPWALSCKVKNHPLLGKSKLPESNLPGPELLCSSWLGSGSRSKHEEKLILPFHATSFDEHCSAFL